MRTLVEYFIERAHRPDDVAVWLEGLEQVPETITWGRLTASATRTACGLLAHGVASGDRVLLVLPTGADFLRAFYGILLAGAIPVPVYPPLGQKQLAAFSDIFAFFAAITRPRLVLTIPQLATLIDASKTPVTTVAAVAEAGGNEAAVPATSSANDVALVQFSSGSTGDPQGICLTHANIIANVRAFGLAIEAQPNDIVVSWLPLYHDMGLIGAVVGSMVWGLPLVLLAPTDFLRQPSFWLRSMARYGATIGVAPQFAYNLCLARVQSEDLAGADLSRVRVLLNGAEPVQLDAVRAFEERYAALGLRRNVVRPCYGLGENALAVTIARPGVPVPTHRHQRADDEATVLPSAGQPVEGIELRIRGPRGRWEKEGTEGEICIRGASVCSGYLGPKGMAQPTDARGWLRTGDLGLLHGGELYVTGRVKDLVIVGGRNFYPHDIEHEVSLVPGIRAGRAAVFAVPLLKRGTEAVVVAAETTGASRHVWTSCAAEVRARLLERFGVVPHDVVLLQRGNMPRTTSGKIRRFRIRSDYQRGVIEGVVFRLRTASEVAG